MDAYREGIVPVSMVSGSEPSRPRRIACGVWCLGIMRLIMDNTGEFERDTYPLPVIYELSSIFSIYALVGYM